MCVLQVEGEAQGKEDIMQKFFQQLNKGPRMAHVVKLEKRDLELRDGEDNFAVMRTAESMFE
jgi:acylphosphatase